jgi:peroxiredoxin
MRSPVTFILILVLPLLLPGLSAPLRAGQSDSIVVQLRRAPGYGPFTPVVKLSYPGGDGPAWERALPEVRGIPVDIHGFSVRYLNMQPDQYVFQSFRAGLIDKALALGLISRNGWDTAKLTPKYVNQDVPVVAGIDREGNIVFVVDTKADHSFWGKDRIVIPPFSADRLTPRQMDSLNALVETAGVTFELYDGKKVRESDVAVRVLPYVKVPPARAPETRGKIVFGLGTCEYRRGLFKSGERLYMCTVSNGFQSGVYGAKENEFCFFPSEDSSTVTPASSLRYRLGDRVEVADDAYRISSVAIDGSSMTLRSEKKSPGAQGVAIGSIARDFEGMTSGGDRVGLSQFRGSYLLLNFWFPGSPACTAGLPYINDIYAAYGGGKVRVLGMALEEGPPLSGFTSEHGVSWPQVILRDTSRVLRDYAVGGYPATFLIDPEGKIVQNGRLRGGELADSIAALLKNGAPLASLAAKGNAVFRLQEGRKTTVEVAGDFTGWLPVPLYRSSGEFLRHVAIPAGRHHYMFIVDGEWVLDPSNASTEDEPSGRTTNVLVVN